MPAYSCSLCNFSSRILSHYNRHLKTRKHLRNVENSLSVMVMSPNEPKMSSNEPKMSSNEPKQEKKYICEFCNTKFKTQPNKRRHELHNCKKNSNFLLKIIDEKDKQILKMENDKTELYKKMDKLLDKVGDTNIQQNIILNNYGDEDMSHITDSMKYDFLKIPFGAIPKMIEAVHFNKEKPENKNIFIPNKKENLIKIFKNNKWIYKNKDEALNDLVDSKYMFMDNYYDKVEEKSQINKNIKCNYIKFRKFYDEKDKEMVEQLKKECELILLNNR